MKTHQNQFTLRLSVVAVQSALFAMAMVSSGVVRAEDPSLAELTTPASTVEIGVVNVSQKSAKFGEYNGLNKSGAGVDLSFDLRGKAADENDPTRFSITGRNLGFETREFGFEYEQQGKFRLNFGYDELRHNISDDFKTPYQGVGTGVLTMPSTWIKPVQANVNPNATTAVVPGYNANALSPAWIANDTVYRFNNATNSNAGGAVQAAYAATPAQQAAMLATAANDNALFQSIDLYTKRTKYSAGFDFILNKQWSFTGSASQEAKVGLKPKSYITGTETALILPDPINENHNQFNLSANYRDDKAFLTVAYYGSLYENKINGVTVEEAQGRNLTTVGTMLTSATPPSNQMHQLNVTGGYKFSPTTKLVTDASYARGTQDQAYLGESMPTTAAPAALGGSWLPTNSLHGLVITKSFDLKLTHKPFNDLNLAAAYKYNDRHNETPVNTYIFQDLNGATAGNSAYNLPLGLPANAIGAGNNGGILANRALSKTVNQVNLDADYRLTKEQTVKLGYDWQKIERYCDGSWIDCATADATKENTLRAEWRIKPTEDLSARVAYAYSERRAGTYNTNAWLSLAPMANLVPNQTLLSTGGYSAYQTMQMFGLSAWGPMGQGYPATVALGTANPGQGYTAAQWASALGITAAQATTQLTALNALSKTQWGTYLNTSAASISDKQLAALNQYFALGNKLAGANVGTRNFLSLMPGQQLPFDGDRNRDKLRTALNWQATDKLSLGGSADYNRDNYNNTSAGLTDGRTWSLNLDANLTIGEKISTGLFFTHEDRLMKTKGPGVGSNADGSAAATGSLANTAAGSLAGNSCNSYTSNAQELQNAKIDPCLNWATDTTDKIDTLGLNLRHQGLMAGKLDLSGSASFTKAVTTQKFPAGGVYVSTLLTGANFGAGATPWTRTFVPAADMPAVTSKIITLSLVGKYTLDKASAIRLGYTYQRLSYDDWMFYNTLAGIAPAGSLPSMQQSPTYTVHAVGAQYLYSFR
jgi:MtrB/PioB family decaheme-associated outer membrane protein